MEIFYPKLIGSVKKSGSYWNLNKPAINLENFIVRYFQKLDAGRPCMPLCKFDSVRQWCFFKRKIIQLIYSI